MSKNHNVPQVRFKGFTDAWEQRKFKNVFDFLQNNALSRAYLSNEEGTVLNVHYGDILVKFGEVIDIEKDELPSIVDESIVKKYTSSLLQNGDVIIADAAEDETVGKCSEIKGLNDKKVLAGLHTIPVRPKEKYACGYLGYYMNSGSYHNQLLPLMQGTKVSSISKSAIQDTDILYPKSEAEQQQIGSYFHNLDNLITLHQRKCYNLKKIKKAMLQKMFPKNGETVPEIRFKGFTDAWEQRKVGVLAENTYGGGTPNTSNAEFWNGNIPWIQSSDIIEHQVFGVEPKKYITSSGLAKSAAKLIPENSIAIITRVGVGKLVVMPFSYATSQDFLSLSNLKIDVDFGAYLLYKKMQSELNAVQGTSIKGITKDELLNKAVLVPRYEEQTQIGSYFHNLDTIITLHQRKLETLKKLKKSMLQKMFP